MSVRRTPKTTRRTGTRRAKSPGQVVQSRSAANRRTTSKRTTSKRTGAKRARSAAEDAPRRRRAPAGRRKNRRRNGAALPWKTWALRGGLGALLLAAMGAAVWFGRAGTERLIAHPALAVETIEIVGAARATADELDSLLDIVAGDPWLAIDGAAAEFRVESHPWVKRARVRRPWPGRVVLRIDECLPLARVKIDGEVYGLCEDLRIVPSADATLPLVEIVEPVVQPARLSRGLAYTEEFYALGITEIVEVRLGGELDRVELPARGFTAAIGPEIPVERAARNVAAFLEKLDSEGASRGTLRVISEDTAVWEAVSA